MSSESKQSRTKAGASDSARAAEVAFKDHNRDLRLFLLGLLRDSAAVDDALQSTFAKLLEQESPIASERIRAWLFRVARNEAMLMRRRASTGTRHAGEVWRVKRRESLDVPTELIRKESVDVVRRSMNELSDEHRMLITARIYEGMKFREIAETLNVPLGTVLSRMQSALKKLSEKLSDENDSK